MTVPDPASAGRRRFAATGTFILTTGRSGSTFLARTLQQHPELAVVSDLIEPVTLDPYFDDGLVLDGDAFWELLTRPALAERISHWRTEHSEELLYLPDRDEDVSLLMAYTLPFLSDDPWGLRAELETAVRRLGPQRAPDHFIGVAEFLRDRFSATTWIERTGGSLAHAAPIVAAWPEAKYVLLSRDPIETALSMRTGSFFRLCRAHEDGRRSHWQDPRYACPTALAAMVERWTTTAAHALRPLPTERRFDLTYERLIEAPSEALGELLRFVLGRELTPADTQWARERAITVSPAPQRAPELSAPERDAVSAACPRALARWAARRERGR